MRTVLPVFCVAADELVEELIALVTELSVDANLGAVVPLDRRILGHHEERVQRRMSGGYELICADRGKHGIRLVRIESGERLTKPRHRLLVERCQATHPLQGH